MYFALIAAVLLALSGNIMTLANPEPIHVTVTDDFKVKTYRSLVPRSPLLGGGGGGGGGDTQPVDDGGDRAPASYKVTVKTAVNLCHAPATACGGDPGFGGFSFAIPFGQHKCDQKATLTLNGKTMEMLITHHSVTEPGAVYIDFDGAKRFGLPQAPGTYEAIAYF